MVETSPSLSSCNNDSMTPSTVSAVFAGNETVVVTGGTFTIFNNTISDQGFSRLEHIASHDAMHDSAARNPPPKCHPETRKNVVNTLIKWIKNPNPPKRVYWLHAPFGHGKSAVMQTVLDILVKEGCQHFVAGAFFFGRGKPGRDKVDHLICTIAYQMAINLPGLRELIDIAIVQDPALLHKLPEVQLERLIIQPLSEHTRRLPPNSYPTPTVFIDGLDECDPIEGQIEVLDLVVAALDEHQIPLRFIIASRPETHIEIEFSQAPLIDLVERLSLPDEEKEMIAYASHKFSEIRDRHPSFKRSARSGSNAANMQWPSLLQIRQLVLRACGQYIFLDTALRHINSRKHDPVKRLQTIMDRVDDSSAFKDMDTLYTVILEECPSEHEDILRTILLLIGYHFGDYLAKHYRNPNVASIAEICGYSAEDIELVLDGLAAVVKREGHGDWDVQVLHLSFREFLQDKARSGKFHTGEASFRMWNRQVQDAFKKALCGKLLLRNSTSNSYVQDMLLFGPTEPKWTTSAELLDLLRQGEAWAFRNADWDTQEFRDWFGIAYVLAHLFTHFRWLNNGKHLKWLAGELDTPLTREVFNASLGVWKTVVERYFSALGAPIADALLGSLRFGTKASELAAKAGLEEEDFIKRLKPSQGILWNFTMTRTAPTDLVHLMDHDFVFFRANGERLWMSNNREEYYRLTTQGRLTASL